MASVSSSSRLNGKRSFTGKHTLLPAIRPRGSLASAMPQRPAYSLIKWTFGRGSVIWRIWPAVMLHTLFAALVVFLEMESYLKLSIPNVMLTVLGVVIGFVISYRAMSGYDRYWTGRTAWGDVMRNSRSMGRLIWFHVPPRLSPKTAEELASGQVKRTKQEMIKVMAEKRMALDLVEAFAVALKHHLRGEVGIYYEDLYDLVRPLHDHNHTQNVDQKSKATKVTALPPPSRAHRIASNPSLPNPSSTPPSAGSSRFATHLSDRDPVIPAINAYGTFQPPKKTSSTSLRQLRRTPSTSSTSSNHGPLQAARQTPEDNVISHVDGNLIPFASFFMPIRAWFSQTKADAYDALPTSELGPHRNPFGLDSSQRRTWRGPPQPRIGSAKHRPVIAADGENLPLEILRCLSEWYSVLEDRNTVPGTSMGSMIGMISTMEESLSALERILTTPLPFVYAVHISTVWIYLFFLPFQLVETFGWHAVAGVCIAAFIYLGFLAAGEEIEQPFGYDENDLDLDMFCQEIIHVDIEQLKRSPCLNAYLEPERHAIIRHSSMTLTEATHNYDESESESSDDDGGMDAFRSQSPVGM